jgi:mannose-6-phosphate isomerase-like protein (cupin superfamily)
MKKIETITQIKAAGRPPKLIEEFIGNVNSGNDDISIARMKSPGGWTEPGQRPDFTEYTIVLKGTLVVETARGTYEVNENQAIIVEKGEWVRYGTPGEGAEYVSVCLPAFSPARVHRDE